MTSFPVDFSEPQVQKLKNRIEQKTGLTAAQLYEEREKRVRDCIELKQPDRVPTWILPDPVRFCGLPRAAEYYDAANWGQALKYNTLCFEPDLYMGGFGSSGATWDTLGVKNRLWPGGPLPPDYEYQFIESENMKEDEYDHFLSDPSDFIVRRYLPRIYSNLAPLAKLPPLHTLFNGFEGLLPLLTSPQFGELARTLSQAGQSLNDYRQAMGDLSEELAQLGIPAFSQFGGAGGAPFDTVSSFLRGMKGSMLDMYRRPEKLLQLCDALLEQRIKTALPANPQLRGNPKRVGLPLWRGDKSFMSDAQFRKFYWPGLKKALQASIDLGFVPIPVFEATMGDRLECLLELPKGKVIALVHCTDVVKAKEVLQGHTCIIGIGPASLRYATPRAVADFYINLIKTCGKGGGFMLNLTFPAQGTTEEMIAMVDEIKAAGRY
jgi:hypothetical protein